MKKYLKKIVVFLLTISILTTFFPISIFAEETIASGTCGDNLTWVLHRDGNLVISGNGNMTNWSRYRYVSWYEYSSNIINVTVEEGVTSIGSCAFRNQHALLSVSLPESLLTIEDEAFRFCDLLTSIDIPESVTKIGTSAFYICRGLNNVNLPENLTTIGNSAFVECKLKKIRIPASVESIGTYAFRYVPLEEIVVDEENKHYSSDVNGVLFNKSKTELITYPIGNDSDTYIIPNTVKTIKSGAFSTCSNLVDITIPDSVMSIESYAFLQCFNLEKLYLSKNLRTIDEEAFYECVKLKNLSIPDSVSYIGINSFKICSGLETLTLGRGLNSVTTEAFRNCRNLKKVEIPSNITKIENAAFWYCDNIEEVCFEGSEDQWNAITIENNNYPIINAKVNFNCDIQTSGGGSLGFEEDDRFMSKYGWCIPNYWEALGYEEGKYRISPERYSEVYGISMSSLIYSGLQYVGNDAGRCFGLSLLAACNYLGKIDLSSYFASGGDCLYEYGYSSIETYEEHGTQFYSIKGNNAALHLIERAHIVQKSVEIEDYEIYKDSDFSELINHFSQENATPILMNMEGYGHTVLLTSDKFETNGNTVLISMWDPNLPYDNLSLQTPMFCYENDVDKLAYFKFDRVTLKWEYWKQGKICASGEKNSFLSGVSFYDVSQIPATFFSDTLNFFHKHVQIDLYGSDVTIENENGDTLLKIENNKIVNIAENCDYECTYNNGSENTIQTGTFYTDDTSKLTILSDDAEFLAMSQDYYFASSITESAEIVCDFSAGTITVNNLEQNGCKIDIGAQNVDKNYAVSTTTDLNYNDSISLCIGDSKAEVKTNKNENDIILENDGIELNDVDVVHEHTEKSIPEISATCTETGLSNGIYCSVCEIAITEQSTIPATGHSDANHDGVCDNCSEDFTKGCSCNCHGNAFMQFLHKIVSFLRKLFGMNQYQYCNCGKAHW